MAVFRVEKNRDYTVMCNHHLRNRELSLKAKGLLSQMLSLPDDWDYTLNGLAYINRDKIDAIRQAVKELERAGYITRSRERDGKGCLRGSVYIIREQPILEKPTLENPMLENPTLDNPTLEKPTLENPTQLNTNRRNKEKSNTDLSTIHQSIYPAQSLSAGANAHTDTPPDRMDEIRQRNAMYAYEGLVKENIEYDILCERYGRERMDEVVELILEAVCVQRPYFRICGQDYPGEVVKSRMLKLGSQHIEYVFNCIDTNTKKVRNIKSYMLTTLYNAPATIDHYYRAEVNHDLYGAYDP